jgi:hypothetical protein
MSHDIDIAKAREFIDNYKEVYGRVDALLYSRKKIEKILEPKNCKGLRIYYGLKQEGENALIIVGYDDSQKDINANLSEYVGEYGIANVNAETPLLE